MTDGASAASITLNRSPASICRRVLKLARTIAVLRGEPANTLPLAEALQYLAKLILI